MERVTASPPPGWGTLLSEWSLQPLAVVALVMLTAWYVWASRRVSARGDVWPRGRTAVFGAGVALAAWMTSGFPEAYGSALFWVWITQALTLLLVVPLLLLYGQPVRLARLARGRPTAADAFLASRPGRLLSNPLVGPALVPVLCGALFFGPVAGWAIHVAPVGWVLQVVLVVIGGLVVLPLVDVDADPSSLAVGLALAIGSFELVLDAIPGIALRLHTTLATTYFDHRVARPWAPSALHDQQLAGGILWCVAELLDLPFLGLVFLRWLRADARDAAAADAVLDAERAARAALVGEEPRSDAPWWLTDPVMQERFRREHES